MNLLIFASTNSFEMPKLYFIEHLKMISSVYLIWPPSNLFLYSAKSFIFRGMMLPWNPCQVHIIFLSHHEEICLNDCPATDFYRWHVDDIFVIFVSSESTH